MSWKCPGTILDIDRLLLQQLRAIKTSAIKTPHPCVPYHLEMVIVPENFLFAFPGVYIFTGSSRIIRPVMSVKLGKGAKLLVVVGQTNVVCVCVCVFD
jgi:hypothetical protein